RQVGIDLRLVGQLKVGRRIDHRSCQRLHTDPHDRAGWPRRAAGAPLSPALSDQYRAGAAGLTRPHRLPKPGGNCLRAAINYRRQRHRTGDSSVSEVTRILSALAQGDSQAAGQLLPLVYDELRRLAADRLGRENPGQTLQPTALVHEAYLRLVEPDQGRE